MGDQQKGLDSAETLFRKHGGMLRASEAVALGIHPRTLYRLRDENRLVAISRGLDQVAGWALFRVSVLPVFSLGSDPIFLAQATKKPSARVREIIA